MKLCRLPFLELLLNQKSSKQGRDILLPSVFIIFKRYLSNIQLWSWRNIWHTSGKSRLLLLFKVNTMICLKFYYTKPLKISNLSGWDFVTLRNVIQAIQRILDTPLFLGWKWGVSWSLSWVSGNSWKGDFFLQFLDKDHLGSSPKTIDLVILF